MSPAVFRAYQRAMKPSIPMPLYGLRVAAVVMREPYAPARAATTQRAPCVPRIRCSALHFPSWAHALRGSFAREPLGGGAVIISVINHTEQLSDEEVQAALRAVNRQVADDFEPYWSLGARLRLEGRSPGAPKTMDPPDMRGDAVPYLWDEADVKDAVGYHERNNDGVPYGFVFTDI